MLLLSRQNYVIRGLTRDLPFRLGQYLVWVEVPESLIQNQFQCKQV